jgi:hypothetical protein
MAMGGCGCVAMMWMDGLDDVVAMLWMNGLDDVVAMLWMEMYRDDAWAWSWRCMWTISPGR